MPLQAFAYPFPETRFFTADNKILFRFKIRGGTSYRTEAIEDNDFDKEFEDIVRTVLGNLDSDLQPFSTNHYTVFPYKKRWEVCKHSRCNLKPYPFTIILYVEKNMHNGKETEEGKEVTLRLRSVSDEPQSKRCRRDSPLEEAILQDLIKDMEVESYVSTTGKVDQQHADGKVKEDPVLVDEAETAEDTGEQWETPVRPGILRRLASHILPFLFRSSEDQS
ncbi:membrane-anchored junction protein [Odontesthes bonariensis]|uniref:membrane-anchored junction protein n=1 Tax=Odontesthes bonariensis TaxID=219752 RepID=UPI003F582B08